MDTQAAFDKWHDDYIRSGSDDRGHAYPIVQEAFNAATGPAHPALHGSAPEGHKCSDCTIESTPCPDCYTAWWRKKFPNNKSAEPAISKATVLLNWWKEHPEYIVGFAPSGQWSAFDKARHTCYADSPVEVLAMLQFMHSDLSTRKN